MSTTHTIEPQSVINHMLNLFLKIGTSAGLAALVTAVLLFFMCTLIAMEPAKLLAPTHKLIEVVMTEERVIDTITEEITKKPVDPEPIPQTPSFEKNFENSNAIEISMAPLIDQKNIKINPSLSSGSAMAIFKVAPQYPRRAITRNIEGYVDLMFDITVTGKTENIRIIYAEPKGYFENTSRKTLAKWKYKPAMEDGIAQPQKNQTTRIVFELDK